VGRKWTSEEDDLLAAAIAKHGARNWKAVADLVPGRSHAQCLQRWAKVLKPGLKKGQWTKEEDLHLANLVHGGWKDWTAIAKEITGRTSKQCRERWFHHLDPSINRSAYSEEEDQLIMAQTDLLGSKWAQIARMLNGRTGEAIKIRWKTLNRHRLSGSTARCPQITRRRRQISSSTASPKSSKLTSLHPACLNTPSPKVPEQHNEKDLDWISDVLDTMVHVEFEDMNWNGVNDQIDFDELLSAV